MSDDSMQQDQLGLDDDLDAPRPRRRFHLAWLIPVIGMAASAFYLAQSKDDLLYLFQPGTPVDLGQPGSYQLEGAAHGVYAKIRGEVHSEGIPYQDGFSSGKVWPLKGAPVIVKRRDFSAQRGPLEAEGMLQIDDKLRPQYHPVIVAFLKHDQLAPPPLGGHVWVLVDGHTPHGLDATNGWIVLLLVLFGLNTYWFVKPIVRG